MKPRALLLALAALFVLVSAQAQSLTVARVVDGDTFALSDGRRVRLIGIDTPEKHPSAKLDRDAKRSGRDKSVIRQLGEKASQHAQQLVEGKPVALEYDQANAATGNKDRYGRTLAYVWVLGGQGQRLFMANARLVEDGYANAYTLYPFKHSDEFRRLETEAREARRGLWADDALESVPPEVQPKAERAPPATQTAVLVGSAKSDVYHVPMCRHAKRIKVSNLVTFPSVQAAQARGYRACKVCRPR